MLPLMSMLAWEASVGYPKRTETNRGSSAADQLRQAWKPSEPERRTRRAAKARATFHLPAGLLEEMRDTVVALSGPPHRLTMSGLAEDAIRRELRRLQREAGGQGKAIKKRASEVTRGRPIR